jgi:hypothetical protein
MNAVSGVIGDRFQICSDELRLYTEAESKNRLVANLNTALHVFRYYKDKIDLSRHSVHILPKFEVTPVSLEAISRDHVGVTGQEVLEAFVVLVVFSVCGK